MRGPFTASLEWRRQHVSDRTWIGMGAVTGGLFGGVFASEAPLAWRLLSVGVVIIGVGLLAPTVRERIRTGRWARPL